MGQSILQGNGGGSVEVEFLGGGCFSTNITLSKDYDFVALIGGGIINHESLRLSISPSREKVIDEGTEGVSYNRSYRGDAEVYKDCKKGDKISMKVNPGACYAIGIYK